MPKLQRRSMASARNMLSRTLQVPLSRWGILDHHSGWKEFAAGAASAVTVKAVTAFRPQVAWPGPDYTPSLTHRVLPSQTSAYVLCRTAVHARNLRLSYLASVSVPLGTHPQLDPFIGCTGHRLALAAGLRGVARRAAHGRLRYARAALRLHELPVPPSSLIDDPTRIAHSIKQYMDHVHRQSCAGSRIRADSISVRETSPSLTRSSRQQAQCPVR